MISKNTETHNTISKLKKYHAVRQDLDHQNVVRLFNVFEDCAYYIYVEEHVQDFMTLDKFIQENK